MNIKEIVLELCKYNDEQEWFEFKENWFQPDQLGEYISALSNAAAFHYKKYAYFIWGITDDTHEISGTKFNLKSARKCRFFYCAAGTTFSSERLRRTIKKRKQLSRSVS